MRGKFCRFLAVLLPVLCLTLSGCTGQLTLGAEDQADTLPWHETEEELAGDAEETESVLDTFALAYHEGQSLDPITCGDGAQVQLSALLYEPLFQLDAAFVPQSVLCSGYTVSEDGLVYTLDIRQGVAFSDGSFLTAGDVAACLRRAMASQRYGNRLADVRQVSARGDDTVEVTLSRPNSRLPALLDIPVIKAGSEEHTPIGTGPYLFVTSGEGAYLAANPDWWQGRALPVERIELVDAKDSDTVRYLFTAREIQLYAADLTAGDTALTGRLDTVDIPTAAMQFIGINARREALQDQALRQALQLGIPRETVVEGYLSGHALPAQFPVSPAAAEYPEELEEPYSLEEYRRALTALWTGGESPQQPLTLRLLVNSESAAKSAIAHYLAQSLTVEGIVHVEVEALPWTDYLEALESGDFDLYYGEVRLSADWDISALVGTGGALNYGGWSAVDTDAMLDACRSGKEAARRSFCQHLQAAVPLIPVCFPSDSLLTHSGTVENASPTAANVFYHFSEWTIHLARTG